MPRKHWKSWKWPGLRKAAAKCGVSFGHARLVLAGERESRKLVARLRDMNFKFPPATKTKLPSKKR
jgi:hypothetical protein